MGRHANFHEFYNTHSGDLNVTSLLLRVEQEPASDLVAIGLCFATVGSVMSGIGMNLIRGSSVVEGHKAWYCRWRLMLGAALATCINTVLDTAAFAMSPLSTLAPLGGVALITGVFLSRLGCAGQVETLNKAQAIAIALILAGVWVVAAYGPAPSPVLDSQLVLSNYHATAFQSYQIFACLVSVLMYAALSSGLLTESGIPATIASAITAGVCSGMCQVMLKVLATTFGDWALHGATPFGYPEFWWSILILVWAGAVLFHMMKICLSSSSIALSSSCYQSSVILCTIVSSNCFFGELHMATTSELTLFFVGVANVVAGLTLLCIYDPSHRRAQRSQRVAVAQMDTEAACEGSDGSDEILGDDMDGELTDHPRAATGRSGRAAARVRGRLAALANKRLSQIGGGAHHAVVAWDDDADESSSNK